MLNNLFTSTKHSCHTRETDCLGTVILLVSTIVQYIRGWPLTKRLKELKPFKHPEGALITGIQQRHHHTITTRLSLDMEERQEYRLKVKFTCHELPGTVTSCPSTEAGTAL